MKFFQKTPDFDIMGKRKFAVVLSICLFALGGYGLASSGIHYGIDFKGGTIVQAKFTGQPPLSGVRSTLGSALGQQVNVTTFGEDVENEILITLPQEALVDKGLNLQASLGKILTDNFPSFTEIRRVETVGPKVGAELKTKALEAALYALVGILLYISVRFKFHFAIASVAALFHDVIVTMGIFVLMEKDFTLTIVAALLTIIGYSLNDTIVVFDRIRENIARMPKSPLKSTINLSINESLSRTILTSVTTFLVVLALFLLGGEIIHDFCFAMLIGLVVGTYSSVFVASPVVMLLDRFNR
ncbi:MAG: protein translocase subunit SecF [SAR324 cluster bacterium]|nr:protein translocase subunit SecF [SAR324 cluster bacterium]